MVKEVKDLSEYKEIIKTNKLVCVDYFATWCGPCRMIAPKLEALEKEYTKIVFIKVDVDKASEISEAEKIKAMPTFKFFKDGHKHSEVVGASEQEIRASLIKLVEN